MLAECEFGAVTSEPHTSFFALYDYLTARGMGFATLYTEALASKHFAWGNALFVTGVPPGHARADVRETSRVAPLASADGRRDIRQMTCGEPAA